MKWGIPQQRWFPRDPLSGAYDSDDREVFGSEWSEIWQIFCDSAQQRPPL